MAKPLIGILMATYNGERFISEQIESILNQTYKNWKLIIHDDGSNDLTIKTIKSFTKKYPNKILLIEDSIRCGGAKENFAHLMKIAKDKFNFDYIMFSDQDDIWLPNKITISLEKMKQLESKWGSNTPLLVYTDLKIVDENLKEIYPSLWKYQGLKPNHNSLNYLLIQNIITGCSMLINKNVLVLSLPIPQKAVVHDWWIALVVSSFGKLDFISTPTVLYRQHNMQVIGAKKWNLIEILKTFRDKTALKSAKKRILETILQAEEFFKKYRHLLSNQSKKMLTTYINILNLPFYLRIYYIVKYRFLKSGFLRNLGLFLLILLD